MKKSKFKIDVSDDSRELFKTVQVIVKEANEKFEIWKQWHNLVEFESTNQTMNGIMVKYAEFSSKRPCWATFWVEMIGDYQTVFVDPCGSYQDFFKLDDAIGELFPNASYHINSTNFHSHPAWNQATTKQMADGFLRESIDFERKAKLYREFSNKYASLLTK
jgi:hypothetical protein